MTTPLAALIERHLNESKRSQKDLAAALQSGSPDMKLDTFVAKLSKLLSGRDEGEKFFDKEGRLERLAREVGHPSAHLKSLRAIPSLVLHPSVPAATAHELRRRANERYGTAGWITSVDVDASKGDGWTSAAILMALTDASRSLERTAVIVAMEGTLTDPAERDMYMRQKLDVLFLASSPRGCRLVGHEDLLPVPPPAAPRMVDETTGEAMYCVPEIAAAAREALDSGKAHRAYGPPERWSQFEELLSGNRPRWDEWATTSPALQRVSDVLSRDEVPTFYQTEILRWFSAQHGATYGQAPTCLDLIPSEDRYRWCAERDPKPFFVPVDAAHRARPIHPCPELDRIAECVAHGHIGRTHLWTHGGRWFVVGDAAAALQKTLRQHCVDLEIYEPEFPDQLVTLLGARRNPWVEPLTWLDDFRRTTTAECGIKVEPELLGLWRNEAMLRAAESSKTYRFCGAKTSAATLMVDCLKALLDREMILEESSTWIHFVLRRALEAPMLAESRSGSMEVNAIVDLGAGNLVRLRLTRYPVEAPGPMTRLSESFLKTFSETYESTDIHLDAGDMHLQLARLAPSWLSAPPRR